MGTIVRKDSAPLARPLSTLAPLIREEIAAGDAAGIEHYRRAGEMLIEARNQCERGEWLSEKAWLRALDIIGVDQTPAET